MTNRNALSALHIQWKNLWELFIRHPGAKRKLYHNWTGAPSKVSPASSPAADLRKTLQEKRKKGSDSAGSSESAGTARATYRYARTTAAPAFPASPKAAEIAQVWDSQGKFCYALQRNVPPTAVVSSHKRLIREIISEVHGIVCRLY